MTKKILFVFMSAILLFLVFSCGKTEAPLEPQIIVKIATFTVTSTVLAVPDYTKTATKTRTITPSATRTPTITVTSTQTMTYNATQIIEAALTIVAAEQTVNAVLTVCAQQTADAQQTAVAAETVMAQQTVYVQQTAAASRTAVAQLTVVAAAQTVVASQTAVAQLTAAAQQTVVAAQTMVVAVQTIAAAKTALASCIYRDAVPVPTGTFEQFDFVGNSTFTHAITIPYEMAKYEVTYELWFHVRNWGIANGYTFANLGREGYNGTDGAEPSARKYEPVTRVNWRSAIVWCNAYSEMTGQTPVYFTDAAFTIPLKNCDGIETIKTESGSYDKPYVNWNSTGYRIPTEGEWEMAARRIDGIDWTPSTHISGDGVSHTVSTTYGNYAWYVGNALAATHPVGLKLPNALGIFDMSGNVKEWCWDWVGDYPSGSLENYRGAASGTHRSRRSGSYRGVSLVICSGFRNWLDPFVQANHHGLRVVRTMP